MALPPKKTISLGQILKKASAATPKPVTKKVTRSTTKKWSQRSAPTKAPVARGNTIVQKLISKERRVQTVLTNIDSLPSLPAVVTEVLRLANNPESCATDFEDCVRKDQALTAKVLKLVNSSFFGLNSKINTISRSVVVLGYKTLKSVVLAASTSKLLDRNITIYHYDKGGLWMQALSTASIARHLGSNVFQLGQDDAEELFIAGLLHNIGKIVISPVLQACKDEVLAKPDPEIIEPLDEMEQRVAGIDTLEAGSKMMAKWNLSSKLVSSVQFPFDSLMIPNEDKTFTQITHLAVQMALHKRIGLSENYPWTTEIEPELLLALNISEEQMKTVFVAVDSLLEELAPLLQSLRDDSK